MPSLTFILHKYTEFSYTKSPNIKIIDLGFLTIYITKKSNAIEKLLNDMYYKDDVERIYDNLTK